MTPEYRLEAFEYYRHVALARALMFRALLQDVADLSEVPEFVREYRHARRELGFWRARIAAHKRKVHK